MPIIFSIFIVLAWLTPAVAGNITFNFQLQDNQCVIANRGDSSAYYPLVYQLGREGQWTELKSGGQPAEFPPGGTLTAELGEGINAASKMSDIDYLRVVLIRFFDQAGVSFGHIALLRPPPDTGYKINAGYVNGRFRLDAPREKDKILATWVIAPLEEGIASISGPLTFTHRQPPATRIMWNQKQSAEIETGAALPAVILLHETPDGLTLQRVQNIGAKKIEQRTAWLNMKRAFYMMGMLCGICGIFLSWFAFQAHRKEILP